MQLKWKMCEQDSRAVDLVEAMAVAGCHASSARQMAHEDICSSRA